MPVNKLSANPVVVKMNSLGEGKWHLAAEIESRQFSLCSEFERSEFVRLNLLRDSLAENYFDLSIESNATNISRGW